MTDSERWIRTLRLGRHPEGGWFREIYRAPETIASRSLPSRFTGQRSFSTAIYFLLESGDFSAFHRLRQDELWHFYDGAPLTIHLIDQDGNRSKATLGRQGELGQQPMVAVRAGCWFGALAEPDSYTLVGCTVSPGFEFEDLEISDRQALLDEFPQHRDLIRRLTR